MNTRGGARRRAYSDPVLAWCRRYFWGSPLACDPRPSSTPSLSKQNDAGDDRVVCLWCQGGSALDSTTTHGRHYGPVWLTNR
jgi:hypothetical protein